MYATPTLATRFARNANVIRSAMPLAEDQMRRAAPSIFAEGKHGSRSERYTYIPTIDVLRGLRKEGFEPFMVAQGKSRIEGKSEFTKHMIRMRHVRDDGLQARPEAQEIILINSHDGASSYQMLAGVFRFVCCNGLVVGDIANDIRIPHKGNIQHEVIEGAFRVLDDFEVVEESTQAMKGLSLKAEEQSAFASGRPGSALRAAGGGHAAAAHHRQPADASPARRGCRRQFVEHLPAGAGEQPAGWSGGPFSPGTARAYPARGQH